MPKMANGTRMCVSASLGLLMFAANFVPICTAEEPDTLLSATEVLGEYCDGYFDQNQEYHEGFQCTGTLNSEDELYCCGIPTNKYCCDQGFFVDSINIGNLIGILVGVFVVFSICVILCCCCCSCCFCRGGGACSDRHHHHHHPRRTLSTRFLPGEGLRATLLRARRKRRAPNAEASPEASTSRQLPQPPRHHRPAPTQPTQPTQYPPQSPYPPNQQYPPQQQHPPQYPANYPPQPYPHPVPRMVNQPAYSASSDPLVMVPTFSAPPPPYTATASAEHQLPAPPLLDKQQQEHGTPPDRDEYPAPGATYPSPPPSPRYPPPPPVLPRYRFASPSADRQAPPLLDKQSALAQEYPDVAYPPPSSRRGPPSAPPDEDANYPRKM